MTVSAYYLFDSSVCALIRHAIYDDSVDRRTMFCTLRLSDIRAIKGGCGIVLFLEGEIFFVYIRLRSLTGY